ncbi:MAG: DNRLRE domain-containing protein [Oscillospiraceae bacterium]|nr:DNRLRE domain-containing protein [Oscillospiraceae bacterium]
MKKLYKSTLSALSNKVPAKLLAVLLAVSMLVPMASSVGVAMPYETTEFPTISENFVLPPIVDENILLPDVNDSLFLAIDEYVDADDNEELSPIIGEDVSLRECEFVRHYLHEDGTITTALFAQPVNFLDESGIWQDIDNRLLLSIDEDGNTVFVPAASGLDISIPQEFCDEQLTTIRQNDYRVSFGLIDIEADQSARTQGRNAPRGQARTINASAQRNNRSQGRTRQERIAQQNEDVVEAENLASVVAFDDVLPGIDLEQVVTHNSVSEHIIINETQEEYSFDFQLELDGLIPAAQEDGSFLLISATSGEEVFELQAPMMFDATGEAYSVDMELRDGIIAVSANADWINTAAMPVTIAPLSLQTFTQGPLRDTYVNSSNNLIRNTLINFVGTHSVLGISGGTNRTYMRFDLSSIPSSNLIMSANLQLTQNRTYSFQSGMSMHLYRLTQAIPASLNWNNQPTHGSRITTRAIVSASGHTYNLSIPNTVRSWHENPAENHGFVIMIGDENRDTRVDLASSRNALTSNRPALEIRHVAPVTTWARLRDAINAAPANTATTLPVAGSFSALATNSEAIVIPADRRITLVSSDTSVVRTITQAQGHRHFIVHGELTLGQGVTLRGGAANNSNDSGGVEVRAGGSLRMNTGSSIEHCRRTIVGGAVSLIGSGTAASTRANFTLAGGTIRNNSAPNGGGVNIGTNGQMTMTSGLIQNNVTTDAANAVGTGGGGVRLSSATSGFELRGGTIENNISAQRGGGVLLGVTSGAVFTMINGTIRGNTATGVGGGVALLSSNATSPTTFTMSNGIIENNTASNGGGVGTQTISNATAGPVITMTGGTIRSNTATTNGGGVHLAAGANFTMNGVNARIENNRASGLPATDGGGGVNVAGSGTEVGTRATFTFTSGIISDNEGRSGGGVRIGTNARVNMTGGTITNNRSFSATSTAGGGGVHVRGGADGTIDNGMGFNMTGGTISNNTAANNGGGIFTTLHSTDATVPATAYANLRITAAARFYGNQARQDSLPPSNRLTSIATTASVSVWNYALNNYDINYTGLLGQGTAITSWAALRAAVNAVSANTPTTLRIASAFSAHLSEDTTPITIPVNRQITLVSSNTTQRNITQGQQGERHFIVQGSLTLGEGITLRGGAAVDNTNDSGGVEVRAGGHFTMLEGSVLENNRHQSSAGGAVTVVGTGTAASTRATFTLDGGTIRNNQALSAGGVNLGTNSRMTMSGGLIQNNSTTDTASNMNRGGGGVRLNAATATFEMSGGTIENNSSARHGGGVHLGASGASFTMRGGIIRGNIATQSGGGVNVASNTANRATFFISGGTIENNTAARGGGVATSDVTNTVIGPQITMTGGTIRNNTATINGGGVNLAAGAEFTMNGATARIENNRNSSTATTSGGGGINVAGSGTDAATRATFTLQNGTVSGNEGRSGGGVRVSTNARVNMTGGTITNNRSISSTSTAGGGGLYVSSGTIADGMGFNMTGGTISNNTAANNGGAIFSTLHSTLETVPATAYANLNIAQAARFSGNTAGTGPSAPPTNRLARIATTASVSIWDYALNNHDINYTGRQGQGTVVTSWAALRTAVDSVPPNTPTTLFIDRNISSLATNGEAIVIAANQQITIASDTSTRRTLTQAQNGHRHFIVHGSLTLGQAITFSGGAANNTNNSGGVEVRAGGTFTMRDGSIIENCRRTIVGGAVALAGTGTAASTRATFTLAGGTIRNNQAVNGGGVELGANSHMTMTSGLIQNNSTTDNSNNSGRGGGGVRLFADGAVFEMTGGTIENNTSARHGGGVHVGINGTTFRMRGGVIRGNTAANNGGGVGVSSAAVNRAIFEMTGGTVENNTAGSGGGIGSVDAASMVVGPQITMTGGIIRGNTATTNGGGVHVMAGATFTMNGVSARIENNRSTSATTTNGGGGVSVLGSGTDAATRATFTLTNGTIHNNTAPSGGGVRAATNAHVNMTNGTISNNTATTNGGGVHVAAGAEFTMNGTNARIENNRSTSTTAANGGGGINLLGSGTADSTRATLTLQNGIIDGNEGSSGGGVRVATNGRVNMTGGTIRNNIATANGGGVHLAAGAEFTMNGANARIENNNASSGTISTGGGGVNVEGSGTAASTRATFTLQNGTIHNNQGNSGGGIRVATNGRVNMTGGTISNNRSRSSTRGGGGVYVFSGTIANGMGFNMTGGTISNNTAVNNGGGIFSTLYSNAFTIPATAYANLNIASAARFSGNRAGQSSLPPTNRLARIATTASVSIGNYALNNYDINYTGRLSLCGDELRARYIRRDSLIPGTHVFRAGRAGNVYVDNIHLDYMVTFDNIKVHGQNSSIAQQVFDHATNNLSHHYRMPAHLSHNYNTAAYRFLSNESRIGTLSVSNSSFGNGWLTSYNQFIFQTSIDAEERLIYFNRRGEMILFHQVGGSWVGYCFNSTPYREIRQINASVFELHTVYGNVLRFDRTGLPSDSQLFRLREIRSTQDTLNRNALIRIAHRPIVNGIEAISSITGYERGNEIFHYIFRYDGNNRLSELEAQYTRVRSWPLSNQPRMRFGIMRYAYDSRGNLTTVDYFGLQDSRNRNRGNNWTTLPNYTTHYVYSNDANNRLIALRDATYYFYHFYRDENRNNRRGRHIGLQLDTNGRINRVSSYPANTAQRVAGSRRGTLVIDGRPLVDVSGNIYHERTFTYTRGTYTGLNTVNEIRIFNSTGSMVHLTAGDRHNFDHLDHLGHDIQEYHGRSRSEFNNASAGTPFAYLIAPTRIPAARAPRALYADNLDSCQCTSCEIPGCECRCENEALCNYVSCNSFTVIEWDANGNVIESGRSDGTRTMSTQFSFSGNRRTSIDPFGRVMHFEHEEDSLIVQAIDGEGGEVTMAFDDMQNLISLNQGLRSIQYIYNDDGLLVGIETGSGTVYSFVHNEYDMKTAAYVGGTRLFARDLCEDALRVNALAFANGQEITYMFNEDGAIAGISLDGGGSLTYAFEIGDNVVRIIDNQSGLVSTFNETGNFTIALLNNENVVLYESSLDEDGNFVDTVNGVNFVNRHSNSHSSATGMTNSYTVIDGANAAAQTQFDWFGRALTSSRTAHGTTVESVFTYADTASRASARLRSVESRITGQPNRVFDYTFDNNGNITEIRLDGVLMYRYTYDEAQQLIREDNRSLNQTFIFSYDNHGNILSRTTHEFTLGALGSAIETINYAYENANWPDLLTGIGGAHIVSDSMGNPVLVYDGVEPIAYFWTAGRQLAHVMTETQLVSYTYDVRGMMTSRTVSEIAITSMPVDIDPDNWTLDLFDITVLSAQVTRYTWHDDLRLAAVLHDDGTVVRVLYDQLNQPFGIAIQDETGIQTLLYERNPRGDILSLINPLDNSVVVRYTYDAWGNTQREIFPESEPGFFQGIANFFTGNTSERTRSNEELANLNPLTYRGKFYDAYVGLFYLQTRWYNPQWGRFLNADVLFDTGNGIVGTNMFAYCDNNPVNVVDHNGMWGADVHYGGNWSFVVPLPVRPGDVLGLVGIANINGTLYGTYTWAYQMGLTNRTDRLGIIAGNSAVDRQLGAPRGFRHGDCYAVSWHFNNTLHFVNILLTDAREWRAFGRLIDLYHNHNITESQWFYVGYALHPMQDMPGHGNDYVKYTSYVWGVILTNPGWIPAGLQGDSGWNHGFVSEIIQGTYADNVSSSIVKHGVRYYHWDNTVWTRNLTYDMLGRWDRVIP